MFTNLRCYTPQENVRYTLLALVVGTCLYAPTVSGQHADEFQLRADFLKDVGNWASAKSTLDSYIIASAKRIQGDIGKVIPKPNVSLPLVYEERTEMARNGELQLRGTKMMKIAEGDKYPFMATEEVFNEVLVNGSWHSSMVIGRRAAPSPLEVIANRGIIAHESKFIGSSTMPNASEDATWNLTNIDNVVEEGNGERFPMTIGIPETYSFVQAYSNESGKRTGGLKRYHSCVPVNVEDVAVGEKQLPAVVLACATIVETPPIPPLTTEPSYSRIVGKTWLSIENGIELRKQVESDFDSMNFANVIVTTSVTSIR